MVPRQGLASAVIVPALFLCFASGVFTTILFFNVTAKASLDSKWQRTPVKVPSTFIVAATRAPSGESEGHDGQDGGRVEHHGIRVHPDVNLTDRMESPINGSNLPPPHPVRQTDSNAASANNSDGGMLAANVPGNPLTHQEEVVPVPASYSREEKSASAQDQILDITHYKPINFSMLVTTEMINNRTVTLPHTITGLSTPCWVEELPPQFNYDNSLYRCHINGHKLTDQFRMLLARYSQRTENGNSKAWRMRCFPSVFLLGVAKCGTTDLFEALTKHQDVARPDLKEPEYWSFQREKVNPLIFNVDCASFKDRASFADYLDLYDSFAERLRTSPTSTQSAMLLGDYSTHTLDVVESWDRSLDAPEFTSADAIWRLWPHARFILMLRDPVDRAYSRYKMRFSREDGVAGTGEDFHKRITRQADGSAECLARQSHRFCVYKMIYGNQGNHAMVNGGLYAVYLEDWLKVVPRQQIHVLRFEDYIANRTAAVDRLLQFLGLGSPPAEVSQQISAMAAVNQGPVIGDMLPETRRALQDFYRPHNARLAQLLEDNNFTWGY